MKKNVRLLALILGLLMLLTACGSSYGTAQAAGDNYYPNPEPVEFAAEEAADLGGFSAAAGVSAANGRPQRVLYGVPGQYAPAPPQGLEGYEWRGGQDGGYWITIRPVE